MTEIYWYGRLYNNEEQFYYKQLVGWLMMFNTTPRKQTDLVNITIEFIIIITLGTVMTYASYPKCMTHTVHHDK